MPEPLRARRRTVLMCLFAALVVLTSAGLMAAAALVPAPPAVLPLVAVVCIGGPMLAAWELRSMLADSERASRAVKALRRHLDRLPETQHPLGL